MTDIEIASKVKLTHIVEIASKIGIEPKDV